MRGLFSRMMTTLVNINAYDVGFIEDSVWGGKAGVLFVTYNEKLSDVGYCITCSFVELNSRLLTYRLLWTSENKQMPTIAIRIIITKQN